MHFLLVLLMIFLGWKVFCYIMRFSFMIDRAIQDLDCPEGKKMVRWP